MTNEPKILIGFSPHEILWMIDRLDELNAELADAESKVSDMGAKLFAKALQQQTTKIRTRLKKSLPCP